VCKCGKCGDSFRFELEAKQLVRELKDDDPEIVVRVIASIYRLVPAETVTYFETMAGHRLPQ
jgi:hypothetical protein